MKPKSIKRIAYSIILSIGFISCGNEQPVLNNKDNPFIVCATKRFSKTHTSYYSSYKQGTTRNNLIGDWRGRIVLPHGLYSVGDTIIFSKPCK